MSTQQYNQGYSRYGPDTHYQEDGGRRSSSNKNAKRAKKAAKKLKKTDKDGATVTEATVEAPPDGGLSAWTVCAGSAVLSSSNSVTNVSLHESVDSVNGYFNLTYAAKCVNTMREMFPDVRPGGDFYACSEQAIREGIPSFYSCLKRSGYNNTVIVQARLYEASYCGLNLTNIYNNCYQNMTNNNLTIDNNAGCSSFLTCYYNETGATVDFINSQIASECSSDGSFAKLTAGNMFSASVGTEVSDVGTMLNYIFLYVSLFCVLLGAVLSVFVGYRIVSIIGSLLLAVGFIVASFIGDDDEILIKILVGGLAGIGSAFLRLVAMVAVLEYFKELRMRAIVLSGLGAVLINFLMIGLTFVDVIDFDWQLTFRLQAIPAGISLIAGFFMKPLQQKSQGRGDRNVGCSTKCSDYVFSKELFGNVVLYLVMTVFLLDQLGRPIFSEGMQPIMREKMFTDTQIDIQPLIVNGGSFLGLLLLLLSWKRHNLADNLAVMAVMDILIGLLALHVPEMTSFAWAVAYSALFGFTDGVFASVIQDGIPEGFNRQHIRMVAGILGLVAGIGTVASGWIGDALDKRADGSHVSYYFSGGCLLGCGILAIISRVVVVRRQTEEAEESFEFDDMDGRRY